jgi:uncharacterized GH25 family protein
MQPFSMCLMVLFLLSVLPAAAHDYWIEASNFQLKPGALVLLYFRVGEHFDGKPSAFPAERVKHFRLDSPTQQHPVAPQMRDPTGITLVQEVGLQVVSFENTPSYVELPAERFNPYLQAEGLEAVLTARQKASTSDQPGKEAYSRCAKALLWVDGDQPAEAAGSHHYDKPVGLTLEILPEKNPYHMKAPASLAVRLLYEGQPLAGVLLMALNKSAPNEVQQIRSGPDGRAEFSLHRSGLWMVKALHMVPAEAQAPEDWRSYWASLTFELPPQ